MPAIPLARAQLVWVADTRLLQMERVDVVTREQGRDRPTSSSVGTACGFGTGGLDRRRELVCYDAGRSRRHNETLFVDDQSVVKHHG